MTSGIRSALRSAALIAAIAACADSPIAPTRHDSGVFAALAATDIVLLGEHLFADKNLSVNRNQACKTCHQPTRGFAAPFATVVTQGSVVQGSVAGKFGARKPPAAAYATMSPLFAATGSGGTGGNFWDGRATGRLLGNPAADQALGPFLNPVEQALPDAACVIHVVVHATYKALFTSVWGNDIETIAFPANTATVCSTPVEQAGMYVTLSALDRAQVTAAYHNVARSIKEFEASLNRFSSRFDQNALTAQELNGAKLFSGKGKCHQCHSSGTRAAFTDFKFHNIGVPRNPANPVFNYTSMMADPGLGGFTGRSAHMGKFKTPTVRNVGMGGRLRTFMHNGALTSLKQVVDFYNTRDVLPVCTAAQIAVLDPSEYGSFDPDGAGPLSAARCWPPAESGQNLDTKQMGSLGLTETQVDAIVAFMKALSDQ